MPNEEELLYGWYSRNHQYAGVCERQSCRNFYSIKAINDKLFYLGDVDRFLESIPLALSLRADDIINNHTLIPLYKMFMPKKKLDGLKLMGSKVSNTKLGVASFRHISMDNGSATLNWTEFLVSC
jgi:hypothetical protein